MKKGSAAAMATMAREQRNCLVKKTRRGWGSTVMVSFEGSWEEEDGTCGSCGRSVLAALGVDAVEG